MRRDYSLKLLTERRAECACAERAAEIGGARRGVFQQRLDRGLEPALRVGEAFHRMAAREPAEKHCRGKEKRRRVRAVTAGDIGRRAVACLRHGMCRAGVERSSKPEAS